MAVIDKMQGLAVKLQWAKPVAFVISFAALGLAAYIIVGKTGIAADDQYLYPSVLLFLWSLSVGGFIQSFANVPEPVYADSGFFKRLGSRITRFYYYLLAFALFGLTLGILFASIRAIRLWAG